MWHGLYLDSECFVHENIVCCWSTRKGPSQSLWLFWMVSFIFPSTAVGLGIIQWKRRMAPAGLSAQELSFQKLLLDWIFSRSLSVSQLRINVAEDQKNRTRRIHSHQRGLPHHYIFVLKNIELECIGVECFGITDISLYAYNPLVKQVYKLSAPH